MLYGRRPQDSRSRLSTVTILPEPTPHPALGRHVHQEMMLDLKCAVQVGMHSQHFGRAHPSPRAQADTKAFEQREPILGAVRQEPRGYVFVAM
jgi:hypothetical protein